MPIGAFEQEVLRLLAVNRNPDSYVAGATVLNQNPALRQIRFVVVTCPGKSHSGTGRNAMINTSVVSLHPALTSTSTR